LEAIVKPAPFDYLRPESVAEALSALAEYGTDARLIAGGQSLGAMLNMRVVTPRVLIDINGLDELSAIVSNRNGMTTGALVRQANALANPVLREQVPLLAQGLPYVGHYQTRNRGTLGGSVAHADPSAEIPLCLATLGGEVELRSTRRRRTVPAQEFFRAALMTAREPDEMVTALHWPVADMRQRHVFSEFSIRHGDYAIVAVACVFAARGPTIRLGFGGCGEAPQVIDLDVPKSGTLDPKYAEAMAADVAGKIECQNDLMATAQYRRQLARVMAEKALLGIEAEEPVAHA
jgi:2-furoyl-CoA dehydrogenase FAD binding subunit